MMKILFFALSLLAIKPIFAQVPTQVIFCITNSKLMIYDTGACAYTLIAELSTGTHGDSVLSDIAFTPNNKLYGINRRNIVEIDTTTGEATPVCDYSSAEFFSSTSLVHLNDSVLIVQEYDSLYAINIHSCTKTSLGYTGIFLDGDLTWYAGDLYGIGAQILYKITFNSSYTTVTSVTAVNDLSTPLPTAYGLVTIGNGKNDGNILIFGEYLKLTSVNPETMEIDTMCLPLPMVGVWGAASCIRYVDSTTVVDSTDDVDTAVTSLNNIEDNFGLQVYPNPVLGGKLHVKIGRGNFHKINLYDNMGRKIPASAQKQANEIIISLPERVASGMYILEIVSDISTIRKKIVIR